jgi:hypothetical protein
LPLRAVIAAASTDPLVGRTGSLVRLQRAIAARLVDGHMQVTELANEVGMPLRWAANNYERYLWNARPA